MVAWIFIEVWSIWSHSKVLCWNNWSHLLHTSRSPNQLMCKMSETLLTWNLMIPQACKDYCEGYPITSYLILPVQRIPRYSLLLQVEIILHTWHSKSLIKCTWDDHPDYVPLCTALEFIKAIASTINEKVREAEQIQAVVELQARITGLEKVLTHKSH